MALMSKSDLKFIEENKHYYVEGFAKYWVETYDYIPNDDDWNQEFKWWMYDWKNVKIDFRYKKIQDLVFDAFAKMIELKELNQN